MIEEYIPIIYFKPDTRYSGVFLVEKVTVRHTKKAGKPYFSLTLKDVTGSIDGIVWNCQNISFVQPGKYIVLEINTKLYDNKLQFTAIGSTLQPFNGVPQNIQDYISGPANSVLEFYATELKQFIDSVEDADYRDILLRGIDVADIMQNAPYGQTGVLACPGGLLMHTAHTIRIANGIVQNCADIDGLKINKSLIILGAIFRNIGWATTTILDGSSFKPRDAFYMTGLYRASARYIDHLILSTENELGKQLPEGKKQALHNICNPVEDIKTIEGRIIASANDMVNLTYAAGYLMGRKRDGNWREGFFVGHHGIH